MNSNPIQDMPWTGGSGPFVKEAVRSLPRRGRRSETEFRRLSTPIRVGPRHGQARPRLTPRGASHPLAQLPRPCGDDPKVFRRPDSGALRSGRSALGSPAARRVRQRPAVREPRPAQRESNGYPARGEHRRAGCPFAARGVGAWSLVHHNEKRMVSTAAKMRARANTSERASTCEPASTSEHERARASTSDRTRACTSGSMSTAHTLRVGEQGACRAGQRRANSGQLSTSRRACLQARARRSEYCPTKCVQNEPSLQAASAGQHWVQQKEAARAACERRRFVCVRATRAARS
jgi:hypothetical protein